MIDVDGSVDSDANCNDAEEVTTRRKLALAGGSNRTRAGRWLR